MSIFDNLLGNLDEVAAKLGLPADKVQGLVQAMQERVAAGADHATALKDVAGEHGFSLDSLQGLLGGAGGAAQGMLGKLSGALDKDGDGNPLNDLGGLAKGLFGKN